MKKTGEIAATALIRAPLRAAQSVVYARIRAPLRAAPGAVAARIRALLRAAPGVVAARIRAPLRAAPGVVAALIGALLLAAPGAHAQTGGEMYQVELIILKHGDAAAAQLRDVVKPELAHRLRQPALDLALAAPGDRITPVTDPAQYRLSEQAEQLTADNSFTVLRHIAWRQPPFNREQARYINIPGEASAGLLKGIAWLSHEQYFQLRLDFQYDPDYAAEPTIAEQPTTTLIPIHMKKVLLPGETHYLDHPIIGVLARISEVK